MPRGRMKGRTPEQAERFKKFTEWYFSDRKTREPQTIKEMCRQLGATAVTGTKWCKELAQQAGYTNDEHKEFLERTKAIAFQGNPKALEIYAKAKGFLYKQHDEERLELTADEYYRILREARSKIQDTLRTPGGVGGMPGEFPVLHQEARENTDQGEATANGEVGGVAISDRPGGTLSEDRQPDSIESPSVGDIVVGGGLRSVAGSVQ